MLVLVLELVLLLRLLRFGLGDIVDVDVDADVDVNNVFRRTVAGIDSNTKKPFFSSNSALRMRYETTAVEESSCCRCDSHQAIKRTLSKRTPFILSIRSSNHRMLRIFQTQPSFSQAAPLAFFLWIRTSTMALAIWDRWWCRILRFAASNSVATV